MTEATEQPQPQPADRGVARWGGRFLVGALLVLVALNVVWVVRNYGQKRSTDAHAAPDFAVRRIDSGATPGSEFRLSAERGHPVLVDFWATWCAPCRAIAPSLDSLSDQYKGKIKFTKLNIDDNQDTPQQYGIRSIPTLLIFKGGKVVEKIVGAATRSKIEAALTQAL